MTRLEFLSMRWATQSRVGTVIVVLVRNLVAFVNEGVVSLGKGLGELFVGLVKFVLAVVVLAFIAAVMVLVFHAAWKVLAG